MNADGMDRPCDCVTKGTYCSEGLRLATEASRLARRCEECRNIANENAFVAAYRAVGWHLHDANDALFRLEGRRHMFSQGAALNLSFSVTRGADG